MPYDFSFVAEATRYYNKPPEPIGTKRAISLALVRKALSYKKPKNFVMIEEETGLCQGTIRACCWQLKDDLGEAILLEQKGPKNESLWLLVEVK